MDDSIPPGECPMSEVYLRFVAGTDAEDAAWLTGIITKARILKDAGELFRHECDMLDNLFDWFNANLPCPPFSRNLKSGAWSRDAVAWFKSGAGDCLSRIRDLVAILEEHGTPVRVITARNPGKIVYSDRFQVVAETPRWGLFR